MTATTDAEEVELDPIEAARRADLVQQALTVEAFGEAFADYGSRLGAELRRRMVKELEDEGTRPSWDAKGIGKIILNVPEAKLAVRGSEQAEFDSWAAQNHPDQIVATIEVPTGDLENVLTLLEEQGYAADVTTRLTARSAWLKNWLENALDELEQYPDCTEECVTLEGMSIKRVCEKPDHRTVLVYVEKSTGEVVPGIFRKPAADPYITRRVDGARKTELRDQVAAFLADRLANGIPAAPDPLALMSAPAPEGDSNPPIEDDGQSEVESAVCTCTHTTGQHRKGQKTYGKCLVTEPKCPCRRFTERTPE